MTLAAALALGLTLARPGIAPAAEPLSAEETAAISQRLTRSSELLKKIEAAGGRLTRAERVNLLQALYGATPHGFAAAETASSVKEALQSARHPAAPEASAAGAGDLAAPAALGAVSSDFVFVPVTPCRLLDTRSAPATKIPAGTPYGVDFDGGNPGNATGCTFSGLNVSSHFSDSTRTALALNVTVVAPSGPGFLSVRPAGSSNLTSTLNFAANEVVANGAIVQDSGSPDEFELLSSVSTHAIVDVLGVFGPPVAKALTCQTLSQGLTTTTTGYFSFSSPSCPGATTLTGGGFRSDYGSAELWTYNAAPNGTRYDCSFRTQWPSSWSSYRCYAICCQIP